MKGDLSSGTIRTAPPATRQNPFSNENQIPRRKLHTFFRLQKEELPECRVLQDHALSSLPEAPDILTSRKAFPDRRENSPAPKRENYPKAKVIRKVNSIFETLQILLDSAFIQNLMLRYCWHDPFLISFFQHMTNRAIPSNS